MSSARITIDIDGFNQARTDPALQADLHRRGDAIAAAAGGAPDFEVIDSPHTARARVIVVTASTEAKRAEATDRVLTRAFDAGR